MDIYSPKEYAGFSEFTQERLEEFIYPCYAIVNDVIKIGFSKTGITNDIIVEANSPYSLANIKEKDGLIDIDVDLKAFENYKTDHEDDWHEQMIDIADVIAYCLFKFFDAKDVVLDLFHKRPPIFKIFKKKALDRTLKKIYFKKKAKVTLDLLFMDKKIISDVKFIKSMSLALLKKEIRDSLGNELQEFI